MERYGLRIVSAFRLVPAHRGNGQFLRADQALRALTLIFVASMLVMTLPSAHAQQSRISGEKTGVERERELQLERKARWLNSLNGSTANTADEPSGSARGRVTELTREERRRLRSDIREAGYSAYAPEPDNRNAGQTSVSYDRPGRR